MPPKRRREDGGGGGNRGGGGSGGGGDRRGGLGGGGGGGGSTPPPALKRRCRSFDLEIRSCRCTCRHHQHQEVPTSCVCVQAISQFKEEVTGILTSILNRLPGPNTRIEQNLPPTYKLSFVNTTSDKIFTKNKVRAADGGHIKIKMVVSNQQGSSCPRLLSANIKIVVLDGDFNADNREGWTSEEFDNHIIRPRDNVGALLTGKFELKLKNGEAYLENITFVDNSKFTRSGKFRLGVKLINNLGERVQEGITEPFTVKDRRGEGYQKRDIPRLDDEVWRLEKIAKNGYSHKELKKSGITSVKHFLMLYYKDEKALRKILSNVPRALWTKMVNHAKKCDPGSALYSHFMEGKNTRLYFSSLGQIVGVTIADQYKAFGDLDMRHKAQVEEWSKDAYKCMTYHQSDYEMYDSKPRPIDRTNFQGSITPGPESTDPTDQIIHEADEQDTSEGNGFSGVHSDQCTLRRLGSRRVRALPSAQENNETGACFDIDGQLDSGHEIQYATPDANCITDSVTLQPTSTANEIIGPVALDQGALTMEQGSCWMPFTNDDSSVWCPEQQVASHCESPFSLSTPDEDHSFSEIDFQEIYKSLEQAAQCEELLTNNISRFSAANLVELPDDVRSCMLKLLSCRRWLKLTALVKWMAIRASKGKAHA